MTEESVEASTLKAVAQIATLLEAHGLRTALVGAAALAVHGYSRATEDIDIGLATPQLDLLRRCGDEIRAALRVDVDVALPDAEDPLGGVITVRGAGIRQIQVINFLNPIGMGDNPGREAVMCALELSLGGTAVGVVDLEHLVAMKLFAGGMKNRADVVELLAYNPDADLDAIAAVCSRHRLGAEWNALLPEIASRRALRR